MAGAENTVVPPLRISKGAGTGTPSSSPDKMAASRPLAELSSGSMRRNSPSYNQATKKMIVSRENSPFADTSSFLSQLKPSGVDFWSSRGESRSPSRLDSENMPDRSPSPSVSPMRRRPSVERLQQASRVRNSKIFALETKDAYDPSTLPIVERPSANRPMSEQFINNSFTRFDSLRKENNPLRSPQRPGHMRTDSQTTLPTLSPTKGAANIPLPDSPEKQKSPSPTKSSLARLSQFGLGGESSFFDADSAAWSDDGECAATPRALPRHAKSVTFMTEPPVIQEYEQQTPEPSVSAASGSREGSWESDEYEDQEMSFDRGSSVDHGDDSFDADLENADKTPVVLPEHWSRMSPDEARKDLVDDDDDVFEGSPEPFQRRMLSKSESVTSDGEARPLPPIPGFMLGNRRDSDSLAAAAERASIASRNLPAPPQRASYSKEDILGHSAIPLEERLRLMNEEKQRPASTPSESIPHGEPEEMVFRNLDTGETMDLCVAETEVEDDSVMADLEEFTKAPPRISRESILRKVRNSKYDFEDEDEEEDVDESQFADAERSPGRPSYAELAKVHPDHPIPSRETSRETSENHLPEHKSYEQELEPEVVVKDEPDDSEYFDMAAIPEQQHLEPPRSPSRMDDYERQSSVIRHDVGDMSDDDTASRYSSVEPDVEDTVLHQRQSVEEEDGRETLQDAMELLTVKDYSQPFLPAQQAEQTGGNFMGLPQYLSTNDYDFGLRSFITPSPPPSNENTQKLDMATLPQLPPPAELKEPLDFAMAAPNAADVSPPSTPGSVIHHSSELEVAVEQQQPQLQAQQNEDEEHETQLDYLDEQFEEEPSEEVQISPIIPERKATIKTGGKLRARPSGTPADFEAMANKRRLVSGEYPVPPIPQAYQAEIEDAEQEESSEYSEEISESKVDSVVTEQQQGTEKAEKRRESRRMRLDLDIPSLDSGDGDLFGLDQEFERVMENQKVGRPFPPPSFAQFGTAQENQTNDLQKHIQGAPTPFTPHTSSSAGTDVRSQKGYLMRQNTKVVVAKRNFSGTSNGTVTSGDGPKSPSVSRQNSLRNKTSPRKPSAEQYLKTEPWNGKVRRKSVRNASLQKHRVEPAPPLPGQDSALAAVHEDYATGNGSLTDEVAEGVERGRLFVKVVGVKDLNLPMPRNDRVYFKLTLDNGLHCVTTSSLDLGRNAPIGQEFELVVLNDLEFQLTLTTKLPPPPAAPAPAPSSPTKTFKPQKQTGFSRLLSSPKKRAERERQEREAFEAEERRLAAETQRKRATIQPTAWDLMHDLVNASDGSFARAYVNLAAHEKRCFGRPLTVDVPCYNEWALEKDNHVVNSVRSKRGAHSGPVRKPPYVIGKLEVQLLYVPKPKGATDEDMPKSMSSAIREIGKASEVKEVVHEGHLSQQGGDCQHWRRRFFRLQGPRLTAYHEHTHQKRAVINLVKATRLVDDRRTLVADPKSGNPSSKNRRKSAFAEEDDGYQYVEEGFRIRFANGETIDFYGDSREDKDGWMEALSQVIGKPDTGSRKTTWQDMVLAREKAEGITPAANAAGSQPAKAEETAAASRTEVRDFTKPSASSTSPTKPAPLSRNPSERKPIAQSVPSSPVKSNVPVSRRPGTPPLQPRTGHRSRDAVKSMIF